MDSFTTFLKVMSEGTDEDKVTALVQRIEKLERVTAQQANLIDKLQNELIRAGRYDNPDPRNHLLGIQALLTRAGTAQGRDRGRRR